MLPENSTSTVPTPSLPTLSTINTVILFVLSAFTVFGNIMVITAMWKDPLKDLRTVPNYLIMNLAISDLILGLVGEPLWGMVYWIHNEHLYKGARGVIDLSIVASFFTLLPLSVERYFMLKTEGLSRSRFQARQLVSSILVIWVISSGIAASIIVFKKADFRVIVAYVVGLPVGLIVVIVYVNMFLLIKRVYRRDLTNRLVNERLTQTLSEAARTAERVRKRELQIAWTIFTLLGVLVLFWAPAIIADSLSKYCRTCEITESITNIMITVGFLNAAVNPVIYALRTYQFRNAVYVICTKTNSSQAIKLIA